MLRAVKVPINKSASSFILLKAVKEGRFNCSPAFPKWEA
jgi:hypothetical protein